MAYEIDFLPVGDSTKSGDAIAFRFGNLNGKREEQKVFIVDGGTKESGGKMVEHIKKFYKTDHVDVVIASHSDSDHTSGLTEVLDGLSVESLWMHKPWDHATEVKKILEEYRISKKGIEKKLEESLQNASDLEDLAIKKKIKIIEPFSDYFDNTYPVIVLSPSIEYYESLLPSFKNMPEETQTAQSAPLIEKVKNKIVTVAEAWGIETLIDPVADATTASNNSSTVIYVNTLTKGFLLTGDAGVPALNNAYERAVQLGIDLKQCFFYQVPHHGSKRNVGPTILNKILGPKLPGESVLKTAYISASKEGEPKHPAKKVVNAFKRRGAEVFVTKGVSQLIHSADAPARDWGAATPLPFYNVVEE